MAVYLLDTNHVGLAVDRASLVGQRIVEARLAGIRIGTCLENQFTEFCENRLCKRGGFFYICVHPVICFWHTNNLFNNLPKAFNMAEFNLFLEGIAIYN